MDEIQSPTWKGKLTALLIGLVLLTGITEGVLRTLMPHWQEFYSGWFMQVVHVPDHGIVTTGKPGFDGYFAQNNGDFRVRIQINDFGLRNTEPVSNADGRIWVVGDSMTFGWGVEANERYSGVIADKVGLKTYNVASPGTDLCGYQALLANMPNNLTPRAVVLGLILENDIAIYDCVERASRHKEQVQQDPEMTFLSGDTLIDKRVLTKYSAIYNFVAVSLKRVDLFKEILSFVGIIKPINTYRDPLAGEEFDRSVASSIAEIETFRKMLPADTPFLVVVAPGRFELNSGDALYSRLRKAVVGALTDKGIPVVDPFESFKKAGYGPTHFAHDGHWTVLGHRLAGDAAAERLRTLAGP